MPTLARAVRRLLTLAVLLAPNGWAQQPPGRVSQSHVWLQLFHEHALADRWTLLVEAQPRRADIPGRTPQQLLLRTGLQREVSAGVRLSAGYAYAGTSVYGEAPGNAPFDEHRVWQSVQLGHETGVVRWAHRFRAEQRWVEQTTAGTPWRFRQRARVMTRATADLAALGVAVPRAYVTTFGELFLGVGATPGGQIFDQSRLAAQAGYRISRRFRLEAGYLQQFIQRGGSRQTENNHTLVVSLHTTSG